MKDPTFFKDRILPDIWDTNGSMAKKLYASELLSINMDSFYKTCKRGFIIRQASGTKYYAQYDTEVDLLNEFKLVFGICIGIAGACLLLLIVLRKVI